MRKSAVFIALFWVVTSACKRQDAADSAITSGKINTISVIIDDQLWNGQVGDSIRNTFAAPVLGLPQEEPLFDINQFPVKLLEGFVTTTRNILVVKKAKTTSYELVENEYATPQNSLFYSGSHSAKCAGYHPKNATNRNCRKPTDNGHFAHFYARAQEKIWSRHSFAHRLHVSHEKQEVFVVQKRNYQWQLELISLSSAVSSGKNYQPH